MQFSETPGLEEVKQHLINSVKNNHIAHAQLFLGNEGSANLTLALSYAKYLNCVDRQEKDACGKCPSCAKVAKLIHPDLHFVFPVSATKNTGKEPVISTTFINEWRAFIRDNPYGTISDWGSLYGVENKQANISREESRQIIKNLSLKAFEGGYKIMIIWKPEFMHPSTANGILKLLEEPPEKTIFLLVAHDADKILTTILSRTQKVKIPAFTDQEVEQYLINKFQVDASRAHQLAHMADGNLNEAQKLLDQAEDDSHQRFRDWMRFCFTRDFAKMIEWAEQYQKLNKVSQLTLLRYALTMMRECLISYFSPGSLQRLEGEELEFVKNFSKVMDPDKLEKITDKLNEAYYHVERNANPKILFTDLSLQVAGIIRT